MGPDMGNYVVAQTTETDEDGMVQTKGAINGGFLSKTDDPVSQAPSVVVSVDDVSCRDEAVEAAGGKSRLHERKRRTHSRFPELIPRVGLWISAMDN